MFEEIIKLNNSNLVGYACIIDRSDDLCLIKKKIVSQIKFKIETFKESDIPDKVKKIQAAIKPGSRNLKNVKKKTWCQH